MAELLVSVRSADEAKKAAAAGASVIDVKEPDEGSLGRAAVAIWRDVRRSVSARFPLSVALGELTEWQDGQGPALPLGAFDGVAYCKLGLAHAGPDWRDDWRALRDRIPTRRCRWIAVVYADWETAGAPSPDEILDLAIATPAIVGVLVDTFDKSQPARLDDAGWLPWAQRVRVAHLKLAIAGGLTPETIQDLAALEPDLIAVRGAACEDGDRRADIDERRVSELAAIVRGLFVPS
ncbi:MAG: (5-formylfuran-3-yl)methyl phosphate synthase [Paludisphaera borealis]|uniref:(5-formylfuran-3-yl)methyl phosphate synthase n=1 Tax=Paludisphaera borealis TaxID=1387353 RepID=UPI002848D204|nr:(5-formylfuran-3-yl)methyl phosphate synthase [Paludisphaera borealis]MDR3619094.1 (5-formylfuran-3-yl)methyl phosphate synthase [Paludisphaera borealis]